MDQTLSKDIVWQKSLVTLNERENLLGQKPKTFWFSGLSASGKSTLAYTLERVLVDAGRACYVLDGDNVRHGLNNNLGFSIADRSENIRRIAEVAKLMNDAGLIVLSAFISPLRADRANAAAIIGAHNFFEIYVSTPLEVCEMRDPKGLYAKARARVIKDFTGISAEYEPPTEAKLAIDTSIFSLEDSMKKILSHDELGSLLT
jgi:adenylyl-sulfate kinase